jgi:CRP-like cAMP-binding protein
MDAALHNLLFEAFPETDRRDLCAAGREVRLRVGQALQGPQHRIASVYFPITACLSLHARSPPGGPEVMMVGFEGALGVQLVLGPQSQPLAATVQCPGTALQVGAADFCRQLDRSSAMRDVLYAYLDVMIQQIAISGGCLHAHQVGERLARRLLMSHDRAHRHDFHVTHDFLAKVLGVRRAGVSTAATQLQRDGLIRYRRGEMCILDRKSLQAASCGCYADSRRAYARGMRKSNGAPEQTVVSL